MYDFELTPDWRQITFYNTGGKRAEISTALSGERANNAIGLGTLRLTAKESADLKWSDQYE